MAEVDAEGAVRLYLMSLQPDGLVDKAKVKKLEDELGKAKDPVERLKLTAELRKASNPDPTDYEADFVRLAGKWAEEHGIAVVDFVEMGVPEDVAKRALMPSMRTKAPGTKRAAVRAPRVSQEEVKEAILKMEGEFKIADITISSPATVKKALNELVESGAVENLGQRKEEGQRGRAPFFYSVVRK